MSSAAPNLSAPPHAHVEPSDQRIVLEGVGWHDFEALLAMRGDRAGLRMYYLDGAIELVSPGTNHEEVKKTLARLLEAYADWLDLEFNGFGSWTIKKKSKKRGAEPDECYVVGVARRSDKPDLAIEVAWTRGGLDKLDIYAGLGVREVWLWERPNTLSVYLLGAQGYRRVRRSPTFPVGSSRVDLQACKLEYSIVSPK